MSKVWLVTAGEYSDYHIKGAFSSEVKAEAYCAAYRDMGEWDHPEVEEYDLDPMLEGHPEGLHAFLVRMHTDFSVHDTFRESDLGTLESGFFSEARFIDYEKERPHLKQRSLWEFRMWAQDKEHAVKIASERLRAAKASGG